MRLISVSGTLLFCGEFVNTSEVIGNVDLDVRVLSFGARGLLRQQTSADAYKRRIFHLGALERVRIYLLNLGMSIRHPVAAFHRSIKIFSQVRDCVQE